MDKMKRSGFTLKSILLLSSAIFIISCAVNPVTGKKQVMLMSEAQEIELGKQYDPQVISTFGEYQSPDLLSFITVKGTEMGKISHRPHIEYHFKILDSPVINAFAVPGGYIYLTRGILAQLNNEAELVGIIGHEMGHITARHSVSQQSKQQMGQLLLIGGIIASKELQQYAEAAMQGMQLLFLKFSRDNEREADRLGVEYTSKIRYDAHKMADFFQVLNKMSLASEQAGVPTFLSTHPDPGDRYNSVKQQSTEWQTNLKYPEYVVNNDSYLKLINGIVYGADPRQGFVDGNTFYHPDLKFKFTFPVAWQFENSPMQVTIAPKDGKAVMVFTVNQSKTLEEAAKTTIEQFGLLPVDNKKTTVNGMQALATVSRQISTNQSTGLKDSVKVLSYFINYNNTNFVFHGLSAEKDFNSFAKVMESSMVSFSNLTDPSKLNVKPKKILVKTVQKAGTLSEILKSYGVAQIQMNELALLNNMELTDKVQNGKLIKIIGE